ncbi:MAG: hypothetical protein HY902_20685, partial [Deltaproteobacteria bacterium]|nr:hypothetical protein [Deltaproteobacteria bacterium]
MKVWILGAGFSAALGGPLLPDLLAPAPLAALRAKHSRSWMADTGSLAVGELYSSGINSNLWSDAEAFLACLTSIESGDEHANLMVLWTTVAKRYGLHSVPYPEAESGPPWQFGYDFLRARVPALVAAQCMEFVQASRAKVETWLPYERWARSLGPEDVVISFNYDQVVETVFSQVGRP